MAISTYAELQTAIADFLNRDDLTSVIPTFIGLAEAQIARDIRHWEQEKRVTTTLDEQYENLPSDWLQTITLTLSDGTPLELMSRDEMATRRLAGDDVAGKPCFYRHNAGQIEVYPTPDEDYTLYLQYYARIPALSDTDTTNWLLTNYPDIYLYCSLSNAAVYLRDPQRVAEFANIYGSIAEQLMLESNRATTSGSSLRMRVK